jgi:hypothetical protein
VARSKHRGQRRRSPIHLIGAVASASAEVVRRARVERRAFRAMPKPVSWDWAVPRLVPLLAGPYFDRTGEALVRSVLPPGVAVTFGIDLGHGVVPFVDLSVAQRWECTADQICAVAVENLERRSASIDPTVVVTGTLSGHLIGKLERPPGWASSLLLAPEHLKRLFGDQDQLFVAAGQGTLISLPVTAPRHVARDLVWEYESRELYPLMLDPFALIDGTLLWGGSTEYDDDDDDDYVMAPMV